MSFYGKGNFPENFSAHKTEIPSGTALRFGGGHAQLAYDTVSGNQVEVVAHHSGVNVVTATDNNVATLILVGINPTTPAEFTNLALVDVIDTITLDENTSAVILEGYATLDGTVLDATTSIPIVGPSKTLTGSFKAATFNYNQP